MSEALRKRLLERRPDGKPAHVYRKAADTDLAATFARIRRQQKAQQQSATVTPLRKAKP